MFNFKLYQTIHSSKYMIFLKDKVYSSSRPLFLFTGEALVEFTDENIVKNYKEKDVIDVGIKRIIFTKESRTIIFRTHAFDFKKLKNI